MGRVCREFNERIQETIERPVERWEERWVERRRERCRRRRFRIGRFFCRLLTELVRIVVRVVVFITVTVTRWVTRVICEVNCFILDVVAFLAFQVLSIPGIGGILRTILNWVTEILWRLIGIVDFVLSLFGLRIRKKMYVGLIIPRRNGEPIASEAALMPQIEAAQNLFDTQCNIDLIYTGMCSPKYEPREGVLTVNCDASGFFADWGIAGSYFEWVSSTCRFQDGWRRLTGFGSEILVIVVDNILPDTPTTTTEGCSFAATHNYITVERSAQIMVTAHEIGHACLLRHSDDPNNLMTPLNIPPDPILTNTQIAIIRWSKHCVFI
ncbi:MAG: hypothetical protein AAFY45_29040 [Bacteroidota bacterium]